MTSQNHEAEWFTSTAELWMDNMRLADFILDHMEQILQAWEDFARSVSTPMPAMDSVGLRDHAQFILRTVALDMRTSQTESQQIDKAHGLGPASVEDTAAQTHAMTRLMAGFTMDQMVSEYRALRSSVLRLWLRNVPFDDDHQVQDMIRFNEAIDQALVESIETYGEAVEVTRKTVLGVLGHDLRSPLGAVLMAGGVLQKSPNITDRERKLSGQICSSIRRANKIVDDLLDLARCNLGLGIPISLEVVDISSVCGSVVAEVQTRYPDVQVVYSSTGQIYGQFDSSRMAQVFSNLIGNAVLHGDSHCPIRVSLATHAGALELIVQNYGEPIPPSALPHLFNPSGRYSSYAAEEKGASAGLGLGLFISAEIVRNHGGRIEVASSAETGTTFTVSIPLEAIVI